MADITLFEDYSLFLPRFKNATVFDVFAIQKNLAKSIPNIRTPWYPRRLRNHWVSTIHQGNSIGMPAWSLPIELGPNHPMSKWVPIKWWEEYADQCGFNLSSKYEFQLKRTKYVKTIKLNVGFKESCTFCCFCCEDHFTTKRLQLFPSQPSWSVRTSACPPYSKYSCDKWHLSFWNLKGKWSIWLLSASKWSFTQQLV